VPFTKDEAAKLRRAASEMRNGARFVIALTLVLRKGAKRLDCNGETSTSTPSP
jgi:hypothetical protein